MSFGTHMLPTGPADAIHLGSTPEHSCIEIPRSDIVALIEIAILFD